MHIQNNWLNPLSYGTNMVATRRGSPLRKSFNTNMERLARCVLKSIDELGDCVDLGLTDCSDLSLIRFEASGPSSAAAAVVTKHQADAALAQLPKPLQTLLTALLGLKEDSARDIVRQQVNFDNALEAQIATLVHFAVEGLHTVGSQIQQLYDIQSPMGLLRERIEGLVGPLPSESLKQWQMALLTALKQHQAELQDLVYRRCLKKPILSDPHEWASVTDAIGAVESSKHMRDRLRKLAEGELSSLFEVDAVVPGTQAEPIVRGHVVEEVDTDAEKRLTARISLLRETLRDLQRTRESSFDVYKTAVNDTLHAFAMTLWAQAKTVTAQRPQPAVPADLAKADDLLQKEIKYVLQTLTTDRKALDTFLRFIRTAYDTILAQYGIESQSKARILGQEWALQIVKAYHETAPAFQGPA